MDAAGFGLFRLDLGTTPAVVPIPQGRSAMLLYYLLDPLMRQASNASDLPPRQAVLCCLHDQRVSLLASPVQIRGGSSEGFDRIAQAVYFSRRCRENRPRVAETTGGTT